jgi:SAM-dependent methyltransferase
MVKLEALKAHYERFPYPQAPIFFRPRLERIALLNYRAGMAACFGSTQFCAARPRILIAGCGTVEPIAVAIANPWAEIVAVDLSKKSIQALERKLFLRRLRKRVRVIEADLLDLPKALGNFDYIIATGVLHHLPDPNAGLKALEERLHTQGIIRLMLYSKYGREWIERLRDWRTTLGIENRQSLERSLRRLPPDHPFRITYALNSDALTESGLRDAFFHVQEKSLDALEMPEFLGSAGLETRKFLHRSSGQPHTLSPFGETLDPWRKIAVLDRLNVMEENFLFFAARKTEEKTNSEGSYELNEVIAAFEGKKVWSHLLEKKLRISTEGTTQEKQELIDALYLLPSDHEN